MFGSLISGGIGLLGGALGRRDQRKADRRNQENHRQRFDHLREDAEKAGFNPLTALENGGLGGAPQYSAPPLASIQMIQGGLQSFADVATGKAAHDRMRQGLEDDLARVKIDQLRSGVLPPAPVAGPSLETRLGRQPQVSPSSSAASNKGVALPSVRDRTRIQIAGVDTEPNLGWSDAEEAEKRFGEVGGAAYGIGVAAVDAGKTARRAFDKHIAPRLKPLRAPNITFSVPRLWAAPPPIPDHRPIIPDPSPLPSTSRLRRP